MSTGAGTQAGGGAPVSRVTPLELFFDLVFVFTVTRLASLLEHELSFETLWHVAVLLGLIFWMYGGYAWLTNAVPARGTRRQALLLGGLACYLVIAIALPDAFDGTGVAFALAYLVINVVHAALFLRSASASASTAMRSLAPANIGAALAVLAGAAIGGEAQIVIWTLAALFQWLVPHGGGGFEIGPAHFVERHGLIVMIAIGETVVAIGVGASGRTLDAGLIALVLLGLALCVELWWTYFGEGEEEARERALARAGGIERQLIALRGFGYAHYVLLLGIVLAAVGIHEAIAHPGDPLSLAHALALSGGVAMFLAGDAWFRVIAGLDRAGWRGGAATVAVLLAIPVGIWGTAAAGLAATIVLFAAALALERRPRRRTA